jgi:antitoxin component YwqK of YwqJK toxin-antitoxin module
MGSDISRDDEYVYKSCSKNWIVVFQKLSDTKTNESRSYVKNPMYAKFRANKLLVVDIVHKFTNESIDRIENSTYCKKKITYEKGKNVEISDFDEDLDEVCAPGIHYFKCREVAFYYELEQVENGLYKQWYDNGQRNKECTLKDGNLDGLCRQWYENGQLKEKCTYKNGKEDGLYKEWYEHGQLWIECTFENGKKVGYHKEWYEHGSLGTVYKYRNNIPTMVYFIKRDETDFPWIE